MNCPIAKILIKYSVGLEHRLHISNTTNIPPTNILIKTRVIGKHSIHICNITNIPSPNNIPNPSADDTGNYTILINAGVTRLDQLLPFDSTWTTKSALVTDMNTMFKNCTDLGVSNGLSTWDPSGVTNMATMFQSATNFNEDIGGWDVGNVTNMYGMFANNSSFNQDISGWNVSSVTDMQSMFQSNTVFDQDLSDWAVHLVAPTPTISFMFFFAVAFNGGGAGVGSANSVATRATWINTAGGPYTSAELDAAMIYGP